MDISEAVKLLRFKYPKGTIQIDTGITDPENKDGFGTVTHSEVRLFAYGICVKGDELEQLIRIRLLDQH